MHKKIFLKSHVSTVGGLRSFEVKQEKLCKITETQADKK